MVLAISLVVAAAFWAFAEWRLGLLLCLATAILQDPLEKTYTGSTRYFRGVCGSGVWSSLSGGLGAGRAIDSKQICLGVSGGLRCLCGCCCADHPRGLQFIFSLRQSDDYG